MKELKQPEDVVFKEANTLEYDITKLPKIYFFRTEFHYKKDIHTIVYVLDTHRNTSHICHSKL